MKLFLLEIVYMCILKVVRIGVIDVGVHKLITMMSTIAYVNAIMFFFIMSPIVEAQIHATPRNWRMHNVGHLVTFAYPKSFVPNDDGSRYIEIAGGGLMNASHTDFLLSLAVAIDATPGLTVEKAATKLKTMFHRDRLLTDRMTPFGLELSFAFSGHTEYSVFLSPLRHAVREIIVNNSETRHFDPIIKTFLASVHNVIK